RPRAVQESANDFTNLFNLVDALHTTTPEPFTRQVQALVDVDEWMRTFALERFVGNWDSFSYNRGKNMYVYKPKHGPWHMLAWDIDFVLGLGDAATTGLLGGQDASVNVMRSHPPFQRAYWRAFQDLLDGPAQDARINPLLDAKYNALIANGVPVGGPSSIKGYLAQRRSFVQSQLATVAAAFSINSITYSNNLALVSGTAPVKIKTLLFNGNEYPITWTGVTSWTATLALLPGANPFSVLGLDYTGQFVTGASNYVSLVYGGVVPSPVGQVVLNEVMYNPAQPDAEYVELYNTSTNITFDLSGWELRGLSYTFPGGALLGPTNFLVLAADRATFAAAYKTLMPVFDTFSGALQKDGETLTLVRPGTNAASDLVIAKVRYDADAPWPASSLTAGRSLQLIDARQDNWRAGNWTAVVPAPPQWVYFTATGTVARSTFYMYLGSAGDVYIDDMKLVRGSVPEAGANALPDGDFESGFPGPWTVSANLANSMLSTTIRHSGNASLHLIASSAGSTVTSSIWQNISPAVATNQTYTLSFWYLQSTNGGPLVVRLSNSALRATVYPAPPSSSLAAATPGAANSVAAVLPAFPPLWINELQAENLTGITNRAGQRTPWLELFNPTTNTVSLEGLYLANSYTNLTAWPFPAGTAISPRQFKVIFADGQTALSTANEPHTSFTLAPKAGAVALSRLYNGQPQVLDYFTYTNLTANRSCGSFADAQSFARQEFYYPTPGATNNGSSAPLTVAINEWMADNTLTLADPADNDLEDWFELYNYGTNAVDLGGYFLTDALTNKFQFEVPSNGRYVIPPHGFLLVWADGEAKQNSTNRADLHVSFKLDKAGESIGLFGADGTPVDYVTFGAQISDVTMGRYPDGSPNVAFLPAPTPRAKNLVPNAPPVLAPISDRVITLGQTVSLLASATDPDLPLQDLTFKLAADAPSGATIDPGSGQFSWTPPSAPGAWPISVIVSDNGIPSLSATQTFTVTVYLPPQLQDVSLEGNQFTLSWLACAGETYQVEFKDSLLAPVWTPLGEPCTGTGALVTITYTIDGSTPGRFFRVRVLP
ncbi:MAG TPA: lamin tail domain-containing protein, partial [Bacillota bacterium]|nr:lamin tail domain-containing protein [Bacillota bacterium]